MKAKHRITTHPASVRVQVTFGGELIADSRNALVLEETRYRPVYYLPREDVRMERLARSQHVTHCPHKGDACYFSLPGGPDNVAWSYEQPLDAMRVIAGRLAFYPDKVAISDEQA